MDREPLNRAVQVSLLIPTRALPPLTYRIPQELSSSVRIGAAVVVPLAGYSRLGIVVEDHDEEGGTDLKQIQRRAAEFSISSEMVKLCRWISKAYAAPLPVVLRMVLPPGFKEGVYKVLNPASDWPWSRGERVSRATLRKFLGGEGLKTAELSNQVELAPELPRIKNVEWVSLIAGVEADLNRAPRQKELLETLKNLGGECQTQDLLQQADAGREPLRRLEQRGLLRLETRPEPPPVFNARGGSVVGDELAAYDLPEELFSSGGTWLWRVPLLEQQLISAAIAQRAVREGLQAIILAPQIKSVERLLEVMLQLLPVSLKVAPYHGALGDKRASVYMEAREGRADVLVGTRPAVLLPLAHPGVICVLDEPNDAYRASGALDYESVALHARDVARKRAEIEGFSVLFLSPAPSLELSVPQENVKQLPSRPVKRWPRVQLIDMRGTGAVLSGSLIQELQRDLISGERAGVAVSRLGYATIVRCNRCGAVWTCPRCDLPLSLHRGLGELACSRCRYREPAPDHCENCGSGRLSFTGLAVERVKEDLTRELGVEVGCYTAGLKENVAAQVVVGTAQRILEQEWDTVVIPDVDSFMFLGGFRGSERGFRIVFKAAEMARHRLLLQTRIPEHYALQAALRADYAGFAAAELSRRRALRYPPYTHLATLTLTGTETGVHSAVESAIDAGQDPVVEVLGPLPVEARDWRVVLRSRDRMALAEVASRVARAVSVVHGMKMRIDLDPEEV